MAKTIIGLNDAKAVARYSAALAVDVGRESYFDQRFIGNGENAKAPIQRLTDLENAAGEKISFDLSMQLTGQPTEGDTALEGREENLKFFTDSVYIDQARHAVSTGGRMTQKRTLHDLRATAKKRMAEYWARLFDEMIFIYLSGARGTNADYILPTGYTGFANNTVTAPDSSHLMFAAGATKATLTADNKLSLSDIDKAVTKAAMMGGGTQGIPQIRPISFEGEETYVMVMNPQQAEDLRTNANTGQWLDIQKALTTAVGKASAIFKGGLGVYNNVVLHSHKGCIRFTDYGSGAVKAARSLFMGMQAGVIAFGSPGGKFRFDWVEESFDYGNNIGIETHTIFGVKKTTFNSLDFGVIAIDSAAALPA
uniref:N4-gp56 family major capsid protein n=1 Tax=Desulfovibrio sp. U5L TaxID=596152 RepID=I2Q029_9BACT